MELFVEGLRKAGLDQWRAFGQSQPPGMRWSCRRRIAFSRCRV